MGVPKMIPSAQKLLELFEGYKAWAKANPFIVKDWVGKDGDEVSRPKERPLTMVSFENFVYEQGFNGELSHYFSNKDERYSEFVAICTRIRRAIQGDQVDGGMAGIFNPSITQRLNGLVEKTAADDTKEITIKVKYASKGGNIESTPSGTIESPE